MVARMSGNQVALVELLKAEESEDLRLHLAAAINTSEGVEMMMASENPKMQMIGLAKMRRFKTEPNDAKLLEVFQKSPNEAMRNAAFSSLLAMRDDEATAKLGLATKTYNLQTQIEGLEWYTRKMPNEARKMCLEMIRKPALGPLRAAAITGLGAVKDAPGQRDVYETLIKISQERNYTPMTNAINALAQYGDKAAIPFLEKRANHSLHFVRGTVRNALNTLKRKG
jgi:hypothetical protein